VIKKPLCRGGQGSNMGCSATGKMIVITSYFCVFGEPHKHLFSREPGLLSLFLSRFFPLFFLLITALTLCLSTNFEVNRSQNRIGKFCGYFCGAVWQTELPSFEEQFMCIHGRT
jgi:hypothetical protein